MVSDTTIETINYIKDIEIEYNIKLIMMCIACVYFISLIVISYKWESDELWTKIIKLWMFRFPSIAILFFSVLFPLYLFRAISWEAIFTLIIAYYSYIIIVGGIACKLGMLTWAAKLIGLNTKVMKMESKRR